MTGSIVLATNQGLGILAKSFYDNGLIDKVLIRKHQRENHPEWYGENGKWLSESNYEWFLKDLDSILYFEDPFEWKMIPRARERGIKNVLMPMYECTRNPLCYEPDVILCPSLLDLEYFKEKNALFVPVPVDESWTLRKTAEVFVHNAGNGGLGGRNGTRELLEAMKYVKSPIKLIIRYQEGNIASNDPRVELRKGTFAKDTLYDEGDVFIFPEKFNGLSLPLQEAFASGMAVMSSDRFPMNTWLPKEILIPVSSYKRESISVEFESAVIEPRDIAQTIDNWYGKDIIELSLKGKKWAEQHSWKALKHIYGQILSR